MSAPERRDWSLLEVEATVASYLDMLVLERQGRPYNKAERRRALQRVLDERSEPAMERKHMNISAALIDLGLPYIDGYKPLPNYQNLVLEVVNAQVRARAELGHLLDAELNEAPAVPDLDDILRALVDPPERRHRVGRDRVRERLPAAYAARPTNYVELEARNAALGRAGEEFVLNYERARLIAARQERLAGKVEHVAVTRGDHAGYDVLSFAADGREHLIEVKTTKYGEYTPFYVTRNEVAVSRRAADQFLLYRVFDFRRDPRFFSLAGAIDSTFDLEASHFIARV